MTTAPENEPTSEADVATPPRGLPARDPRPVWGEAAAPAPRATPHERRASRARILWALALVVGLLGAGWISSEHFRTTWRENRPNNAAAVDQSGSARLAGITVSLVEATDLGASPSLGDSDWQPPAGFHAWRVVLRTESVNEDITTCDVALVDGGRQFVANIFVDSFVDGYEWSYVCGLPDPDDDVPPEQALLVLVPADAQPTAVRITATSLNPDYLELELD